ncbi:MAG: RsmD family RNA methyltransferase [Opitutaceae bacterium]
MRVTGGGARGIPLRVPARGAIRPAMDSLRERVFSSLGPVIVGARVLDLFAGTGSYGLEALSRGADSAVFVERDRGALGCLKENLAAVEKSLGRPSGSGTIVPSDVLKWRPGPDGFFDIIFADPPFTEMDRVLGPLFGLLGEKGIAREHSLLVLEVPGQREPGGKGWQLERRIGKGRDQPTCCLFRRVG